MAVIDMSDYHTLIDVAKVHNNKTQLDIAKLLHRKNGLVRVAPWIEANQLTTHIYSKEVKLPSGTVRGVNESTGSETPQMDQGVEPLMRIESKSEIDVMIIDDVVPNPKEYRYQYDMRHVEGVGQTLANAFLYYDPADDPNRISGLATRYNALSLDNVHDGGAASNCTEIYVIQFGPDGVQLLYGRKAPSKNESEWSGDLIHQKDMGVQYIITDTTNNKGIHKYQTLFWITAGMVIHDDRAVQRYANLGTGGSDEVDPNTLIWMIESLPDPSAPNTFIFANRMGKHQIKKSVTNLSNVMWTEKDEYGMIRDYFYGVPIILLEAIPNTLAAVS